MHCRRIGADTLSMQAQRTTPTGSVFDTITAFLFTYMMSQSMCWATKLRRVGGSLGGGIGFDLVVLPFSAPQAQIAVARLTSADMTVQFRYEPALRAAMNLLSGGKPRLGSRRASALRWTSRFVYSASLSAVVGSIAL
jgi:hypothetical protein